jgi:hypothetical protein
MKKPTHIHLPSVHVRNDELTGFDYEENVYIEGRGRGRAGRLLVGFALIEGGQPVLIRETRGTLLASQLAAIEEDLDFWMDGENPEVIEIMESRAHHELGRQERISSGAEVACAACGCSESRACPAGCVWATANFCSRCIAPEAAPQFTRFTPAALGLLFAGRKGRGRAPAR